MFCAWTWLSIVNIAMTAARLLLLLIELSSNVLLLCLIQVHTCTRLAQLVLNTSNQFVNSKANQLFDYILSCSDVFLTGTNRSASTSKYLSNTITNLPHPVSKPLLWIIKRYCNLIRMILPAKLAGVIIFFIQELIAFAMKLFASVVHKFM